MDPRGLIGSIYVGHHKILLQTKSTSCGAYGFRECFESFYVYGSFMLPMATRVPIKSAQNLMQPFPYIMCDHNRIYTSSRQ